MDCTLPSQANAALAMRDLEALEQKYDGPIPPHLKRHAARMRTVPELIQGLRSMAADCSAKAAWAGETQWGDIMRRQQAECMELADALAQTEVAP